MSQQSENKTLPIEDILKILHSEAQKLPPSPTSVRYLRALESLTATSRNHVLASPPPQRPQREMQQLCSDWIVNMWLLGVPFTTASLNLDIISALYGAAVRQNLLPKTDIFSHLKAQLKQLGPDGWKSGINEEIFDRALRLTKNANRLLLDDSIAADLVLLSLTGTLQPIERLALLPRDPESHAGIGGVVGAQRAEEDHGKETQASPPPQRPQRENRELLETVIARHAPNARRKYIFPLDQTKRSAPQLKKQVFKIANALFKRARLPQSTDPNQTIRSLWAYAALRTGLPASEVVSYLGQLPLGLPILRLIPHAGIGGVVGAHEVEGYSQEKDSLASPPPQCPQREMREVGRVFLDNPARWYAMSLRPGVRFTQICRRIEFLTKSEDSRLKTEALSLFYPCEEIARAIGKKIVIRQRPFIHSVVFFKAKLTDIGPLFARIGDLAWCYRQSARPGAPYADISEQQFRQFQQTIARFTPDYEVASAGELELKPNDRVEIVGGLFAGHTGTFVKSEESKVKSEETSTVYRLNIIGDNGIEWRVSIDKRLAASKN